MSDSAALPITVRRHPTARTMRLAIDPRDGGVRLTLPKRASLAAGLKWAETQRAWIEGKVAAIPPAVPLAPGATLPFDGAERLIVWSADAPRRPLLQNDRIEIGGDRALVGARILRWLRAQALHMLDEESRAMAGEHRLAIGRIAVGDPRSRWASCSASGGLRYSWRLVMAPPAVRRSVVAHEVAHRLHMDHSPAFHEAVTRLFGRAPNAERAWLREHGVRLQRVGRQSSGPAAGSR